MLRKFKNTFLIYLRLPEMRIFWIFLPLLIILSVISAFYFPLVLAFWSIGILLVIIVITFINSLSLTKSNLEVRREKQQLQSVIGGLTDGVIAYDQNFKILVFSKAAENIFNISDKEAVGQEFSPQDIQNPKYSLLVKTLFPALAPMMVNRSEPGAYPQVVDLSFKDPDLEFRVASSPIKDLNGQTLGFVKIVRDQTRDVQLLNSKSEFLTVASHQLRTPLTSLRWIFESFSKDQSLSEDNKKFAQDGLELSEKMIKIVNDLLGAATLEEGRYNYNFEEADVIDFTEKILKEAEVQAKQLGIKVYFDRPSAPLPKVLIDVEKLGMVFSNLLSNAIRYNVTNGEVTVGIKQLEGQPYLEVSIKDTGIGISEEDLGKLFTKFFRAGNAVETQTEGTGLGLYIAKNIVEAHGGKIWAESELNHGSVFYFTLPTDPNLVPRREASFSQ
ncbi:MAG: ATP-binding protein [Patescibacteria group bacterium]|nr:ATP-binding protein [Patescibacteria group bacterium]